MDVGYRVAADKPGANFESDELPPPGYESAPENQVGGGGSRRELPRPGSVSRFRYMLVGAACLFLIQLVSAGMLLALFERTSVVQLASLPGLNSVIEISGISVDPGSDEQVTLQAEEMESHSEISSQLPLDDSMFISFEPEPSGSGVEGGEEPIDNQQKSRTDADIVDTELREVIESPFSDRVSLALNNESPDQLETEASLEKEAPETAIEVSEQSDQLLPDTGVVVEKNMTNKERLQQEMENEALQQAQVSDEPIQVLLADIPPVAVEAGAEGVSEALPVAEMGKEEPLQEGSGDSITNNNAQSVEKPRQLWKLQVAAFKKYNNAEKLRQELLTRGIDAYIETRTSASQNVLYRVYAGPAVGDFESVKETLETELNLVSGQISPYKG